jgi:hypothetical protein
MKNKNGTGFQHMVLQGKTCFIQWLIAFNRFANLGHICRLFDLLAYSFGGCFIPLFQANLYAI